MSLWRFPWANHGQIICRALLGFFWFSVRPPTRVIHRLVLFSSRLLAARPSPPSTQRQGTLSSTFSVRRQAWSYP